MDLPEGERERLASFYGGVSVCVTGGAGFIGGHLAEALLGLGARVSILDDLSSSDAGHAESLVERFGDRARLSVASILDPGALWDAVEGCGVVFHLAAMGSVPRSIEEPRRCQEVNSVGTLRVLEASRAQGVGRVVYAASSSAYGGSEALPKVETMAPDARSPYAASKLAGEHLVRAWSRTYGLDGVSLRYFNIFGPRQSAESDYAAVVAAFASRVLDGERVTVYGDGTQTRDFTYVDNAVWANLLAGAREGALGGEVVNIGAGRRTSVLELASMMGAGEPAFAPARVGDVMHSLADLGRARALLGYSVIVGVEEGLRRTMAWYADTRGSVGAA